MTTLNDAQMAALGALGHTGALSDRLRAYYLAGGATAGALNDLEQQFLIAQGGTLNTLFDLWNEVLTAAGYTVGTTQEKQHAFWDAGGTLGIEMTFLEETRLGGTAGTVTNADLEGTLSGNVTSGAVSLEGTVDVNQNAHANPGWMRFGANAEMLSNVTGRARGIGRITATRIHQISTSGLLILMGSSYGAGVVTEQLEITSWGINVVELGDEAFGEVIPRAMPINTDIDIAFIHGGFNSGATPAIAGTYGTMLVARVGAGAWQIVALISRGATATQYFREIMIGANTADAADFVVTDSLHPEVLRPTEYAQALFDGGTLPGYGGEFGTWVFGGSHPVITANNLTTSAAGSSNARTDMGSNKHHVNGILESANAGNDRFGLKVRDDSSGNFFFCGWMNGNSSHLTINEVTAGGGYVQRASVAAAVSNDAAVSISAGSTDSGIFVQMGGVSCSYVTDTYNTNTFCGGEVWAQAAANSPKIRHLACWPGESQIYEDHLSLLFP